MDCVRGYCMIEVLFQSTLPFGLVWDNGYGNPLRCRPLFPSNRYCNPFVAISLFNFTGPVCSAHVEPPPVTHSERSSNPQDISAGLVEDFVALMFSHLCCDGLGWALRQTSYLHAIIKARNLSLLKETYINALLPNICPIYMSCHIFF